MVSSKTKTVVHNVFNFAFDWHTMEYKNLARLALVFEQRDRTIAHPSQYHGYQGLLSSRTTSFGSSYFRRLARNSLAVSLKLPAPSIQGMTSSPQASKMSRIPRTLNLRQHRSPMAAAKITSGVSGHTADSIGSKPSTPTALVKNRLEARISQRAKPTSQESQNSHPFIGAHLGVPCTLGALDHLLDCGHKVMTNHPESCGSNCNQPLGSSYINPRSLDEPFICIACITRRLKEEHDEKVSSFHSTLGPVARWTAKPEPELWIAGKVEFVDGVWRELEFEQMRALVAEGRFCFPFYVDEEYESWVKAIASEVRIRSPVCESPTLPLWAPATTNVRDEKSNKVSTKIPRMSSSLVGSPVALSKA